jgi:hypothetical protein
MTIHHHLRHVKKARRNPKGEILVFFAASGTVNAVFRSSKPMHGFRNRAPVFELQYPCNARSNMAQTDTVKLPDSSVF